MTELKESAISEQTPTHYFNGFTIAFGNADFTLTLKLDNRETFNLKASYTVAKTLAEMLTNTLKGFEAIVGQSMLTTEQIVSAIKQAQPEQTAPKQKQ